MSSVLLTHIPHIYRNTQTTHSPLNSLMGKTESLNGTNFSNFSIWPHTTRPCMTKQNHIISLKQRDVLMLAYKCVYKVFELVFGSVCVYLCGAFEPKTSQIMIVKFNACECVWVFLSEGECVCLVWKRWKLFVLKCKTCTAINILHQLNKHIPATHLIIHAPARTQN